MNLSTLKIGVIGLGYVGLPLSVEFGKKYTTVGFEVNLDRVLELQAGVDTTLECSAEELEVSKYLTYSNNLDDLLSCNFYVVTVPTPIDKDKQPDLSPLVKASAMLGKVLNKNDIIVYESTVYPGATEEVCLPEVEEVSGLVFNKDFYAGYSPERINPGDKLHRVTNILKVTSGSTPEVADFVDQVYNSIIPAGTHKASSIRVAEASKVIENIQRDVNIALVNELHQIFTILKLDTHEVIEAAATKWNFMKLTPGMVGGHCISVDPYYMMHKASGTGYIPDLIRKSREINDGMAAFYAQDFINNTVKRRINLHESNIVILGFAFKENCPDTRNTKVIDFYKKLKEYTDNVEIFDPVVNKNEVKAHYGITVIDELPDNIDIAILAVNHDVILKAIDGINIAYLYNIKK